MIRGGLMRLDNLLDDMDSSGVNRITINHLAEALNLTKGTVSKALNEYSDISEATRLRVQRKAAELDYRPLAYAQAIKTGKVRSLGLVFQTDSERPFLADFLTGVSQTATKKNWSLTVASAVSEDEVLSTIKRLIDERKADGFILPRTKVQDARIELLRAKNIPFVLYGRTQDHTDCAWYDIVGENAMCQAVERLYSLGHRNIAFVNSDIEYNFAHLRLQGYLKGLKKLGLQRSDNMVLDGVMTTKDGENATLKLLHESFPPTAILYATDVAALGAYKVASDLGLQIGKELSIISYDGVPEGSFANPPLTTFKIDTKKAGEQLAALLIKRVNGEAVELLRETDPAILYPGESDGSPTVSSKELSCLLEKAKIVKT